MVLLDYPDNEGVTRELVIGYRRRLGQRKVLLAVGLSTMILLGTVVGRTALRSSATGPAPDVHLPVIPFPSASASSSPPLAVGGSPVIVRLHGSQLTPSVVPLQTAAGVPSSMQSAASLMPSATPSPAAASTQSAIVVKYQVIAQADGGFQFEGEVHVVNNGSAPISGWQIAVALPKDQITAIGGASGYVSNHILLMQPAPNAGPLAAGGELNVVFAAEGPEMTPKFCAFNNTACQ
jgi:Cellulose binding domain